MGRQIYGRFFVFATAAALAACAANAPVGTSEKPVAAASTSATTGAATAANWKPADATAPTTGIKREKGYKVVTKNGVEYYCRRDTLTGSRLNAPEICHTKAELDKMAENGQDFARWLNGRPGEIAGADGNGAMNMGLMPGGVAH